MRAMKLRNIQKGLEPDDFNGMTFNDLLNFLQLWYIEGKGVSESRAITSCGLGRAIPNTDLEQVRPGDLGDRNFRFRASWRTTTRLPAWRGVASGAD